MLACLSLKPSILCWNSVILFLWFLIPRTQAPGGLKSNLYSKPSSSTGCYYCGRVHRLQDHVQKTVIIKYPIRSEKITHIHSWSFRAFYLEHAFWWKLLNVFTLIVTYDQIFEYLPGISFLLTEIGRTGLTLKNKP